MRRVFLASALSALALLAPFAIGCTLDPLVSDDIDLSRVFGDPAIEPATATHVEDDPDFRDRLGLFPSEVPYLRAYAEHEKVWYWRITGDVPDFIVPYYIVMTPDGNTQRPVFDVIPGDGGYSPWWRITVVRTTPKYNGERIWSRAAVDAGVKLGILEPPEDTKIVVTAPIVKRDARIQVDPMGTTVEPSWGWFRNERVSLVIFDSNIEVPTDTRKMPRAPVYVFQRVNQNFPLFERAIGTDLDGDGKLISSNNIYTVKNGEPGYTPMWYPINVRTVEDYVSIDTETASTAVGLTAESDFIGADYGVVVSPLVVGPLDIHRDQLEVCPLQKEKGRL